MLSRLNGSYSSIAAGEKLGPEIVDEDCPLGEGRFEALIMSSHSAPTGMLVSALDLSAQPPTQPVISCGVPRMAVRDVNWRIVRVVLLAQLGRSARFYGNGPEEFASVTR